MTLPSHQREVTAHAHNLRGISSCLITAEEVAAQIVFVTPSMTHHLCSPRKILYQLGGKTDKTKQNP